MIEQRERMVRGMTTMEAARILGISQIAVRKLIHRGAIPQHLVAKVGGVWIIAPEALDLEDVRERRPGRRHTGR